MTERSSSPAADAFTASPRREPGVTMNASDARTSSRILPSCSRSIGPTRCTILRARRGGGREGGYPPPRWGGGGGRAARADPERGEKGGGAPGGGEPVVAST